MEVKRLPDHDYSSAIDLSLRIAAEVGTPLFYREREREVALSQEWFAAETLVAETLSIIGERGDYPGHGLNHIHKVAVDAGALVLIEEGIGPADARIRRLVLLVHLAGILHDIQRSEKNHAEKGAEEAAMILACFPLSEDECADVTNAIRNHEAFRPFCLDAAPRARLLADALYDADKFRWGPDNFTETIWAMIIPRGIPLHRLLPRFLAGLEGVRKVRESFRTATGREYGPDFIDRGLTIGRRLYQELTADSRMSAGGNCVIPGTP